MPVPNYSLDSSSFSFVGTLFARPRECAYGSTWVVANFLAGTPFSKRTSSSAYVRPNADVLI